MLSQYSYSVFPVFVTVLLQCCYSIRRHEVTGGPTRTLHSAMVVCVTRLGSSRHEQVRSMNKKTDNSGE
jgi:hypothetical protein